jgi:hypothetical protein
MFRLRILTTCRTGHRFGRTLNEELRDMLESVEAGRKELAYQ